MVLSPTTTSLHQTDSKINSLLKTLPGFEHNKNNNSNSFLGKEISFPLSDTLYPDLSTITDPNLMRSPSSLEILLNRDLILLFKTFGLIGFVI